MGLTLAANRAGASLHAFRERYGRRHIEWCATHAQAPPLFWHPQPADLTGWLVGPPFTPEVLPFLSQQLCGRSGSSPRLRPPETDSW